MFGPPHNSLSCFLSTFIAGVNGGKAVETAVQYDLVTAKQVENPIPTPQELNTTTDNRGVGYFTIRSFLQSSYPLPLWAPTSPWLGRNGPELTVACVVAIYNGSNTFLGQNAVAIPSSFLQQFFQTFDKTANSQIFAIDAEGQVVATTASTPVSVYWIQSASRVVPTGCLTSAVGYPSPFPAIACPRIAKVTRGVLRQCNLLESPSPAPTPRIRTRRSTPSRRISRAFSRPKREHSSKRKSTAPTTSSSRRPCRTAVLVSR